MGKIMVNGIQYAGALSHANNIMYEPGATGLVSVTVQGALTELANASIQTDWNENDATQKDFIKNKPVITSGSRTGSIMVGSNYVDNGTYLMAVGTGATTAANAHTLDQDGNAWFKGNAYVGGTNQSNAQALATVNYVSNQVLTRAPIQHTHSSSDLTGGMMNHPGYIHIHPEDSDSGVLPYIYNDLAFLKKKGGDYRYYYTTDTDYTAVNLNQDTNLIISSIDNMFDGTPSYGYITLTDMNRVFIIDIDLHKDFTYNNQFYISFGNTWWKIKNTALYVMNSKADSAFVFKKSITDNSNAAWSTTVSHEVTTADGTKYYGFDKIRLVLSGANSTNCRIAEIGLIEYCSKGVSETFISRGGCDGIYGHLIPYSAATYSLGTSAKRWNNIYSSYINSDTIVTNSYIAAAGSISSGGTVSGTSLQSGQAILENYLKVGNTKFTYDAANERVVISFE